MLESARRRASRLDANRALPPALLILALAWLMALFAFGGDRGYFYRSVAHTEPSAKNLALAENLSPSDNFRLFKKKRLIQDGSRRYAMYSRFPIGGTALIKLAIAPFDGLSARLTAARTLALLMFCGAAVFAYLAVARLAASRWIGLAAALIAFSSYYALYYSDAVFNEAAMDIFGVMLTFHGMVVFIQDGRFRQLLIKACAALLIGWHVYALLLAFIVFGLAGEVVARLRGRRACPNSLIVWNIHNSRGGGWKYHISRFFALIRSRCVILGAATLLFGIVVLGSNLVNEYHAYGGGVSPAELPSLASALRKVGARETEDRENLNWRVFAGQQLFRAGGAALPYALPWKRGFPEPLHPPPVGVAVGVLAVGGALIGAALARRHWATWAALALFGFFWALPMRVNAFYFIHDYEALFYVGVPLALFGLALMGARRLLGERAPVAAALAATAIFAVSAFQMQTGELPGDSERPEDMKAEMADFDAIREIARGEVVAVWYDILWDGRSRNRILEYYLAGSVFATGGPMSPNMRRVKYVVSGRDYEGGIALTPRNRFAFLYDVEIDPLDFYRDERRRVESAEPVARSDFDLYLEGNTLYYVKEPCTKYDTRARFFLSVHPVHVDDLSEDLRPPTGLGHDSLNFAFPQRGTSVFDGACMAKAPLPSYEIQAIETGQWIPGGEEIWRAALNPPLSAKSVAHYEAIYQAAKASGEPIIRSEFDVYEEGGALTYLKEPCAESDTRGRFFLSVRPVDYADLPEYRRELGHDSLNFDFSPDGIIFGEKCMIRRELPGYEIAQISTGQDAPGAGRLWSDKAVTVAYYESIYQAAKASGEPIIRSDFDVYKEDDALTYLKEPCAENDTRGRFFLSIHPVDIADLPESRRALGHASLNFDFSPDGIIFNGKCMIRRELPGYDIAQISTGQDVPGAGRLWSGAAGVGD